MTHICEYCETVFTTKRALRHHQKTAKFCLNIQCKKGLSVPKPNYVCECGHLFYRKDIYDAHLRTCADDDEKKLITGNNQTTNIVNNNFNQINIAVYGSTASILTPEYMREVIVPELTSVFREGIDKLTETAAQCALINENGNPRAIVSDPSRDKFVIRYDDGDVADIKGARITEIISTPMRQAGHLIMSETNKKGPILKTMQKIEDMKTNNRRALSILLRMLPTSFNTPHLEHEKHMKMLKDAEEADEQEHRETIKLAKKEAAQEEKLEANDAFLSYGEKFKFFKRPDDDKIRWDSSNFYCLRVSDEILEVSDPRKEVIRSEFIGYSNAVDSKIFDLTSKELKAISNLGLSSFLSAKYTGIGAVK